MLPTEMAIQAPLSLDKANENAYHKPPAQVQPFDELSCNDEFTVNYFNKSIECLKKQKIKFDDALSKVDVETSLDSLIT